MNKLINRQELLSIPVPVATHSYKPISPRLILDTVQGISREKGVSVIEERFWINKGEQKQKMRFAFEGENGFRNELCLINSGDKSISLRCGIGVHAEVCWNLQIMAERKFTHKHTGNVEENLFEFLNLALGYQEQQQLETLNQWTMFNTLTLTNREKAELIGRMVVEEKCLMPRQLGALMKEFKNPNRYSHYGCEKDSLNLLFQDITFVTQTAAPSEFINQQINIQQFFNKYAEDIIPV